MILVEILKNEHCVSSVTESMFSKSFLMEGSQDLAYTVTGDEDPTIPEDVQVMITIITSLSLVRKLLPKLSNKVQAGELGSDTWKVI